MLQKRFDKGLPTPALKDKPELRRDLTLAWAAFAQLNGSRQYGFGPQPIPVSEIVAWLELNDITDSDQRNDIAIMVRILDSEWFEIQEDK